MAIIAGIDYPILIINGLPLLLRGGNGYVVKVFGDRRWGQTYEVVTDNIDNGSEVQVFKREVDNSISIVLSFRRGSFNFVEFIKAALEAAYYTKELLNTGELAGIPLFKPAAEDASNTNQEVKDADNNISNIIQNTFDLIRNNVIYIYRTDIILQGRLTGFTQVQDDALTTTLTLDIAKIKPNVEPPKQQAADQSVLDIVDNPNIVIN